MNKMSTATIVAAMFLSAGSVFAQDTTPSPSGSAGAMASGGAKHRMSMQDCRDHAKTATGEKRTDPANMDTDKTCADMMKKSHKKAMKGMAASAPM